MRRSSEAAVRVVWLIQSYMCTTYLIYHVLFRLRNFINTKYFLLLVSTCISWKTSKCCGFSCVRGYLFFLNSDSNHFIPSIGLN